MFTISKQSMSFPRRKLSRQLALGLSLSMIVSFGGEVSAQTADINIRVSEPQGGGAKCEDLDYTQQKSFKQASQSVKLYYIRSASDLKGILAQIASKNPCIKGTVIEAQGDNTIVLYGNEEQRKALQRVITILDLPRESVNLEMWGILISSSNPGKLAEVMRQVNKEIDTTQQLLQYTYQKFEEFAKDVDIDIDADDDNSKMSYSSLLQQTLGYRTALDKDRSLSMMDILLRINAAKDPYCNNKAAAKKLDILFQEERYKPYIEALKKEQKIPFGNYIQLGLLQEKSSNLNQNCEIKSKDREKVLLKNLNRRRAVLDFALQYSNLMNNPAGFDPEALQQSAETLNSVLQPIVHAINRDVEELFIEPTLARIQSIVRDYKKVSYAEVGKTSVQGLNGIKSTVTSTTVSAFDETGPLRLDELFKTASEINNFSKELIPAPAGANTVPSAPVLSLIAALSKDTSAWRAITSGVSMEITPSVLRNSASAELDINFTTGPTKDKEPVPDQFTGTTRLRPLSRIKQNTVSTRVYVNTLDIFALSTFNSQTTEDGGRTYIPVIGTIWQGVFSGVPIIGQLFSWKNSPQSVQHQSIVLTNSFIVPTAMGLATLYQHQQQQHQPSPPPKPPIMKDEEYEQYKQSYEQYKAKLLYYDHCYAVEQYIINREGEIEEEESSGEQKQNYNFNQPLSFSSLDKKIKDVCGNPPQPPEFYR